MKRVKRQERECATCRAPEVASPSQSSCSSLGDSLPSSLIAPRFPSNFSRVKLDLTVETQYPASCSRHRVPALQHTPPGKAFDAAVRRPEARRPEVLTNPRNTSATLTMLQNVNPKTRSSRQGSLPLRGRGGLFLQRCSFLTASLSCNSEHTQRAAHLAAGGEGERPSEVFRWQAVWTSHWSIFSFPFRLFRCLAVKLARERADCSVVTLILLPPACSSHSKASLLGLFLAELPPQSLPLALLGPVCNPHTHLPPEPPSIPLPSSL